MKFNRLDRLNAIDLTSFDLDFDTFYETYFAPDKFAVVDSTDKRAFNRTLGLWCPMTVQIQNGNGERSARNNENVTSMTAIVMDLDDGDNENAYDRARAFAANYQHIRHSTFSHDPQNKKFKERIIIPFREPVTKEKFADVWQRVQRISGNRMDKQCKDPARAYYIAVCSSARIETAYTLLNAGEPLDVETFLADSARYEQADASSKNDKPEITGTGREIEQARRWLSATHASWPADVSDAVVKLLDGASYAATGGRDDLTNRIASRLAFRFPKVEMSLLLPMFAPSIDAMRLENPKDHLTLPDVLAKLVDAQKEAIEKRRSESQGCTDQELIRFLTNNERDEPLTSAEKETHANEEKFASVAEWERAHMLEHPSGAIYLRDWKRGYYGPLKSQVLKRAMTRLEVYGVRTTEITDKGKLIQANPDDLFRKHGTNVDRIVADLTAKKAYFNPSNSTLYEAPAPMRNLTPRYHPEIHQWLKLLGGEKLLQWVASVTYLDRLLSALYIWGEAEVGKSLLYTGLARLWTTEGPTQLVKVLGKDFNSSVLRCPLIVAPEGLPKDKHKDTANLIKEMLGDLHSTYERKYFEAADLFGAPRVIIASNSASELTFFGEMTRESLAATAKRFLIVAATPAAADYLVQFKKSRVLNDVWIGQDAIAEHALWLKEQPEFQPDFAERILVPGFEEAISQVTTQRTRLVCEWIIGYLTNPLRIESSAKKTEYQRANGELWLSASLLSDNWEVFVKNQHHQPSLHEVATSLRTMGLRKKRKDASTSRHVVWQVDLERVCQFAEAYGLADADTLRAACGEGAPQPEPEPTPVPAKQAPVPFATFF